jgi:hypothetical protein
LRHKITRVISSQNYANESKGNNLTKPNEIELNNETIILSTNLHVPGGICGAIPVAHVSSK